jgi:hypothetical protein
MSSKILRLMRTRRYENELTSGITYKITRQHPRKKLTTRVMIGVRLAQLNGSDKPTTCLT